MDTETLKSFLKKLDMTQAELAHLTGSSPRQVARWLSGESPVPKPVATLLTVREVLNR